MKVVIDHSLVHRILEKKTGNNVLTDPGNIVSLRWPTLLMSIGMGNIFQLYPPFEEKDPFFQICISRLHSYKNDEDLYRLFDGLFAENLTQVKALPQLQPNLLIQGIAVREDISLLLPSLSVYQERLNKFPAHTMHDLILYLSWDRMCVSLSRLFDHQSQDLQFIRGINHLRNCLIESFMHILKDERTFPSMYRLFESLFYYCLREENIKKYSDDEWALLNKTFPILIPQNTLADLFFIDESFLHDEDRCYLTSHSQDQINIQLEFARFMSDHLKREVPEWKYPFLEKNIRIS